MTEQDEFVAAWPPPVTRRADWDDVRRRARRSGRPVVAFVVAVVALGLGAAALAETVGNGFSVWLTGSPGRPAAEEERDRFRKADERSAAGLPGETDLRELIVAEYGGRAYRLLGFRTGSAVCMRLAGIDPGDEGGPDSCVAANELERSRDLAVPLRVDTPLREVGPGDPPSPTATFGLIAAEASRLLLVGDYGTREARIAHGAFLALGPGPAIERTTLRAYALDQEGRRHTVPLAPSLTLETDSFRTGLPVRGPERVERRLTGGHIGWLERGEPRGDPLPKDKRPLLPPGRVTSDRVIQPDPNDFLRVGLTWPESPGGEICVSQIARGGVGAGCGSASALFSRGPFYAGWTYAGAGIQFLIVSGVASDDVARLELFLGTGEHWPVPLRDNAFATRVQRAKLPAQLVAYDRDGTVIGIETRRSG